MVDKHHPRRGSLGYKPQTRAARLYPQLTPPDGLEAGQLAGFGGYKAGMTRVLRIDDEKNSATQGQEVADAVTVIEVPPLTVYGIRVYQRTPQGDQPWADVVAEDIDDRVHRKLPAAGGSGARDRVAEQLDAVSDVRLLVHSRPWDSGLGKKTPELFELPIGGMNVEEKWARADELFGTDIDVSDVIKPGQYIDIVAVTKGKGFTGPVKRHGVKTLGRKTQKSDRKPGNIGPWHPDHTSWKVPQAGRAGSNQRTELNKRVLAVEDDPETATPDGGFKNYGVLRNTSMIVKGSVPGPEKRFVLLRPATRKQDYATNPQITHIET